MTERCKELPKHAGIRVLPSFLLPGRLSKGGMHRVAGRQLKMLGTALALHTGQEEGEATRHLFQRLSLGLMRGNTALHDGA